MSSQKSSKIASTSTKAAKKIECVVLQVIQDPNSKKEPCETYKQNMDHYITYPLSDIAGFNTKALFSERNIIYRFITEIFSN